MKRFKKIYTPIFTFRYPPPKSEVIKRSNIYLNKNGDPNWEYESDTDINNNTNIENNTQKNNTNNQNHNDINTLFISTLSQ